MVENVLTETESNLKLLQINMTNERQIMINDRAIEKVKDIEYLGVIIARELKFKNHIENIYRIRNKVSLITCTNI